jgi:hypothetical protein
MPQPVVSVERRTRFHQALLALDGSGLNGASVLGDGWVTQAWLLADGETVARIPKYPWAEMDLAYEVGILQTIEHAGLPFETPRHARQVRDGAEGREGGGNAVRPNTRTHGSSAAPPPTRRESWHDRAAAHTTSPRPAPPSPR